MSVTIKTTKAKTKTPKRKTPTAKKPKAAARGPEQLIATLAEPRRSDMARLHALIRKTVPALSVGVSGAMIGYGPLHYKYPSGREGDTFRIMIASRVQYISLYACGADARGWVAERYREKLPKASIGKSCVRFKRLDDLDLATVAALVRETAAIKYGGF